MDTQQVYTYETVPTQLPPEMTNEDALLVIDAQDTFNDIPENSGSQAELPVAGANGRVPNMQVEVDIANAGENVVVGTQDIHVYGKNPTIVSSYIGIARETWITPAMAKSWTERDNPLKPDSGINLKSLQDWAEEVGGYMVWGDHGIFGWQMTRIIPRVHAKLVKNPNYQLLRKGSQESRRFPGLRPESYAADQMSTGESLGLYEFLVARGITRVRVIGIAGDFCPGTTALNLARKGLEVWVCVDAQASVKNPKHAGTNFTSEELMLNAMIAQRINFYNTAGSLAVNGHLLKAA